MTGHAGCSFNESATCTLQVSLLLNLSQIINQLEEVAKGMVLNIIKEKWNTFRLLITIFMYKIDHFCLKFSEALINLLKHDAKIQFLPKATTWFLFEVNRWFNYRFINGSKILCMIICSWVNHTPKLRQVNLQLIKMIMIPESDHLYWLQLKIELSVSTRSLFSYHVLTS